VSRDPTEMMLSEAPFTADRLVGTWRLVRAIGTTAAGERNENPYGVGPSGLLTYSSTGRVIALIGFGGRRSLSVRAKTEEKAEAFDTFLAYAGRYSLLGSRVTHHVEISSIQNYVNRDLVRTVSFEDDRMTLVTPPTPVNGKVQTLELTWQRSPDS
jgi:Lipocalin-like domain